MIASAAGGGIWSPCQFTTWIQADIPRVSCPTHGVKQIAVPWAEAGSQFTAWFERLAIDVLRECSVTGAAGLLRLTWDEAWGIKERAVARGLSRRTQAVVPHLGVDENAIAKRHRYLTVVADLEQSRVLYLAEDRKQESLDGFWATLTPEQRDGIEAIAMDLWEPYIQSTRAHLEDADSKIVFDKFHVAKHLHDAVDYVRRAEHRALKQADDARLTGTKYLWLMRPQEMTPEQRATFRTLQHTDLKVARAWTLKERFRQFGTTPTAARPRSSSPAGSGARPIADWLRWRRSRSSFGATSPTCSPLCSMASPTREWKPSTRRSNGSRKPLAASATSSTSRPRSISIAEDWISIQPTRFPEEPSKFRK